MTQVIPVSDTIDFTDIKTIIWDLDGTLLDSYGITVDIVSTLLPKHGYMMPTHEQFQRNYHGVLLDTIRGLTGEENEDKLHKLMEEFIAVDNEYIKDANHHLFVDAVALAKRAHEAGVRQIVVTNRFHGIDRGFASPRNIVENSILGEYIDTVICGDEVEDRKPSPKVFGDALTDIHPKHTLVIGDQFVDAEFANNLGARSILVNRFEEPIAHLQNLSQQCQDNMCRVRSLASIRITNGKA